MSKQKYIYELEEDEYRALLHTVNRARELEIVIDNQDEIGCVLRRMDLSASLNNLQSTFTDKELNRFGW